MGLDLYSYTLIKSSQLYFRVDVDWRTTQELSKLPNHTYDDKNAVPAEVICSLKLGHERRACRGAWRSVKDTDASSPNTDGIPSGDDTNPKHESVA